MCSANQLGVLLAGRTLFGVGIGLAMHAAPSYIAETVPASVRGLLISLKEGVCGVQAQVLVGGVGTLRPACTRPPPRARSPMCRPAHAGMIVLGILGGFAVSYAVVEASGGWRVITGTEAPLALLLGLGARQRAQRALRATGTSTGAQALAHAKHSPALAPAHPTRVVVAAARRRRHAGPPGEPALAAAARGARRAAASARGAAQGHGRREHRGRAGGAGEGGGGAGCMLKEAWGRCLQLRRPARCCPCTALLAALHQRPTRPSARLPPRTGPPLRPRLQAELDAMQAVAPSKGAAARPQAVEEGGETAGLLEQVRGLCASPGQAAWTGK